MFSCLETGLEIDPSRLKKSLKLRSGLGFQKTAFHLDAVIQTRILADLVKRSHPARFGIAGRIDHAAQPRVDQGAGAHHAGLEADVKAGLGQAPGLQLAPGHGEHQKLGVGDRIGEALPAVMGFGHDALSLGQDRAHGDFAQTRSLGRLIQAKAHHRFIECGVQASDSPWLGMTSTETSERRTTSSVVEPS